MEEGSEEGSEEEREEDKREQVAVVVGRGKREQGKGGKRSSRYRERRKREVKRERKTSLR